jgi:zinc transport system substrate-binding protein
MRRGIFMGGTSCKLFANAPNRVYPSFMRRFALFAVALLTAILLASALFSPAMSEPASRPGGKLKIVTTILPVYCFTANLAGDLAEVENLLPSGVGPHDYQFTPSDLRKLSQADVIVLNGLELENWLQRALSAITSDRQPLIIEAAAGLESELIRSEEGGHHHHHGHRHAHGQEHCAQDVNPHVWLDPQLAARCVSNILNALIQADPANREAYESNSRVYLERLRQLDREIEELLAPVRGQPFVTYHDAFPYLVRRYGLRKAGVVEQIPDVQPSARYLRQLSQMIRKEKVRVIFTEPQFSSRMAARLSRDLRIQLAELDPLETGPMEPAAYEEGMRRNAETLVKYLNPS